VTAARGPGTALERARREVHARDAERRAEVAVAACFLATMGSGGALLLLYLLGGQPQLEGILLAVCLGGLGVGIVIWSQALMPAREAVEERPPLRTDRGAAELVDTLEEEAGFARRKLLVLMLLGALGGLATALLMPVLSLGPAPGRSLFETPWRRGLRLVDAANQVVRAETLPVGSIITVFPEGFAGNHDAQTVLIHEDPALLQLPGEGNRWAPEGFVAFSKICTHAGCPVGLYRASQHALICPCHQSTFDVLTGAVPTFGPAARPLPQLPLELQADGTFVAADGYPDPVGPSFWNMTHGEDE
jgi:ubiquinol-cytochrome c reductase iron-sulfur subunit